MKEKNKRKKEGITKNKNDKKLEMTYLRQFFQFANALVRAHFPMVTVLNGGIDSLMVFAEGLLEGTGRVGK